MDLILCLLHDESAQNFCSTLAIQKSHYILGVCEWILQSGNEQLHTSDQRGTERMRVLQSAYTLPGIPTESTVLP